MMNEVVISAQNTTNEIQALNLFQANNAADNVNAVTKYSYDFTGKDLTLVTVALLGVTDLDGSNLNIYNVSVPGNTLQAIADALTTLGFGTWYVVGQTINCNNDEFILGNLNVNFIP
jgi:hypothetical protein